LSGFSKVIFEMVSDKYKIPVPVESKLDCISSPSSTF
jgi:hypothetical protein